MMSGPDVEGLPALSRDPPVVEPHQLVDGPVEGRIVHRGNAHPRAGVSQPPGVAVGPEHPHHTVDAHEALEALEHRLAVVQGGARGRQRNGSERKDLRGVPAPLVVEHAEHVIRVHIAESEVVEVDRAEAALLHALDLQVGGHGGLPEFPRLRQEPPSRSNAGRESPCSPGPFRDRPSWGARRSRPPRCAIPRIRVACRPARNRRRPSRRSGSGPTRCCRQTGRRAGTARAWFSVPVSNEDIKRGEKS